MKRLDILDGMRGYFLVFMLLNHLVFVGGYWLVEVNHRQLAFVEDAQGFVFLSGLLIGLVYTPKILKLGNTEGSRKVYARALELYCYAIGSILAILIASVLLPGARQAWWDWIGSSSLGDARRLLAIATFVFQPTYMDILPQYAVYMLFAPLLIWLCLRDKWAHVLVGSFLVWLAAQLGLHRLVTGPLDSFFMRADGHGVYAGFNMMGWQFVFFSALVIGVLSAQRKIDWSRIFSPEAVFLPKAAVAVCLVFLPLRILTAHELMPDAVMEKFINMEDRADFGPVYLLNFVAVAFLVAWTIIAGPHHRSAAVRRITDVLTGLFTLPFLRLIGRHSLHVYVWHVAIVYGVYYLDHRTPDLSQVTKTVIAVTCVALLALPALWREREHYFAGLKRRSARLGVNGTADRPA